MSAPDAAVAFARAQAQRFAADLARLVRFASVSAQPAHAADVRACADWLATHLTSIGLGRAPSPSQEPEST